MIKQTYHIKASVIDVWTALTVPKIISQWSGDSAIMDDNEGTEFKLWGGDIWGTNTKVIRNKLLQQDWYGDRWPKPSKLTIKLSEINAITTIELTHSNIPKAEEKDFADGWKDYYFGPMKELLESA